MHRAILLALCLALLAPLSRPPVAGAAEAAASRFVSLRASEVNLRTGPGDQYPVAWVYRRPGLPLEIIAEFDVWRRVRDWQGEEGWVHSNMLSTRRTVIIVSKLQPLREKPNGSSPAVAQAEAGVIGRLLRCPADSGWCRIEVNGLRGWAPQSHIWGIREAEAYDWRTASRTAAGAPFRRAEASLTNAAA